MQDPNAPQHQEHIEPVDARAATKPGIVRYVLLISLVLVVVILAVVVGIG